MVNKEVKTMIKSCSFSLIIFFFFPSLFISQQDTLLYRITFLDKDFNSFNINGSLLNEGYIFLLALIRNDFL